MPVCIKQLKGLGIGRYGKQQSNTYLLFVCSDNTLSFKSFIYSGQLSYFSQGIHSPSHQKIKYNNKIYFSIEQKE